MGNTAFLFPGQGAQFVGMGRQIVEKCPPARSLFDRAAQILGYDLSRVCFEGPAAELDKTDISQPAIFVTSLAALEMLRGESPQIVEECRMTAGLSLGEFTALVFAGVLSFDEGLLVVQRRGQAMQAAALATSSGMISVLMLERDDVAAICDRARSAGMLEIANYLCPGNIVLSGAKPACALAAKLAEQAGGKVVSLAVAGAFHTSLMKPADDQLAEALAGATLNRPRIPVYSNVDAAPHDDPVEIGKLLVRQVISPVLWEDCLRNLLAAGAQTFYEIGPGTVLRGLLKRIDRKLECRSVGES
ncbi:MAG: [acyl-carrier-protein] S-malonyltransferase [Planctomycetaceae bacterium]|nr:[acyl-carrier-protein] S-malonyltransferase [Planctomycetaceae bacterium]